MGCRASVRAADKSVKLGRAAGKRPAHSGEDHKIADLKRVTENHRGGYSRRRG